MSFSVIIEANSGSKTISGFIQISVIEESENDDSDFETVFKTPIQVDERGQIIPEIPLPEPYQKYLDKHFFLFQKLELNKETISKMTYREYGINANGWHHGIYWYHNPELAAYLDTDNPKLGFSMTDYDTREGRHETDVWVGSDNADISEWIRSPWEIEKQK